MVHAAACDGSGAEGVGCTELVLNPDPTSAVRRLLRDCWRAHTQALWENQHSMVMAISQKASVVSVSSGEDHNQNGLQGKEVVAFYETPFSEGPGP